MIILPKQCMATHPTFLFPHNRPFSHDLYRIIRPQSQRRWLRTTDWSSVHITKEDESVVNMNQARTIGTN